MIEMCDILREEFRIKKIGFTFPRQDTFYACQWEWHPFVYLVIRCFLAVYSTAALITVCVGSKGDNSNILIFLTIWTYIVLTLHLWFTAIIALHWYFRTNRDHSNSLSSTTELTNTSDLKSNGHCNLAYSGKNEDKNGSILNKHKEIEIAGSDSERDELTWYMKISWYLSDVIQTFALIVTIIYFTAIYPQKHMSGSQGDTYNDVNVHALNTVFVLVDLAISARPVQVLHFIYPLTYGGTYVIFSVIYWSCDKENNVIYDILDYNNPPLVLGVVLSLTFVVIPLIQLGYFGLYRLRLYTYKMIYKKDF